MNEHPDLLTLIDRAKAFDGETYRPHFDYSRLNGQRRRVFVALSDGQWKTVPEIIALTGDRPHAAISTRIRDFRKEKYGSHTVECRRRGEEAVGLFEYRLIIREQQT